MIREEDEIRKRLANYQRERAEWFESGIMSIVDEYDIAIIELRWMLKEVEL